jgi:hypothetical protein
LHATGVCGAGAQWLPDRAWPTHANAAVQYLDFAGCRASGLTQTGVLVEPDFFFPGALNHEIGPEGEPKVAQPPR